MASSDDFIAQEISIITQIASMIVEAAKGLSSWSKNISSAFSISAASETANGVSITISNSAPEAMAFERGSGIHGPEGETYAIDPINGPTLNFHGTHGYGNPWVTPTHVDHPGVAARPFLHPANLQVMPIGLEMLKVALRGAVYLSIREGWLSHN